MTTTNMQSVIRYKRANNSFGPLNLDPTVCMCNRGLLGFFIKLHEVLV
jgi:hypothetical protein